MQSRRHDLDEPISPALIRALRERIDFLEEENRQLRADVEPLVTFPSAWGLAKTEKRLLQALMSSPTGHLSHEALLAALYGPAPEVGIEMIRIWASKVRRKLRAAGEAIEIRTVWGEGYGLSGPARHTLREALGRERAATELSGECHAR